jgi:hypothetical protein
VSESSSFYCFYEAIDDWCQENLAAVDAESYCSY